MKKLTKRVLAGGLWFDAPSSTEYISADKSGEVFCWKDKPIKDDLIWSEHNDDDLICKISEIDIGGANWRDCCWFVGDQSGSDDAERREWMARGVDRYRASPEAGLLSLRSSLEDFAAKLRSGDIEL